MPIMSHFLSFMFTSKLMNINSIRNKYDEIKELLSDKIVDLLFIAETKLDQSFNDNLFSLSYRFYD
jgi:exonuclease III